jgi:signal transduction histidine kinase/CheY-like chemotaxis protein
MYSVFELFNRNRDMTFFPVVNDQNVPLGIIREFDLKPYAYGMFGRELIKHENIVNFFTQCPIAGIDTRIEEILSLAATSPNGEGIILTEKGIYCGVLSAQSIMAIFEENRKNTLRRLTQAQKMEAIGTLAGGIAHDFNNILTPIMGYAELIKCFGWNNGEKDPNAYIEQIMIATRRAKELVNQILAFSRQKNREKITLHLSTIVKEVSKLLRSSLPSTIEIKLNIDADRDVISADPTEIHQVIMNLCSNAAHAMRANGGILTFSISRHTGPVSGWTADVDPVPEPCVRLSVTDTGHGIDGAILGRIFEPFFTTKKQGEGTGMGLSVLHGIVKSCGGVVSVETETAPGKSGTTFNLHFPLFTEFHQTLPHSPTIADLNLRLPLNRTINVLCVDDEKIIVDMIHEMLELVGFNVTAMDNSIQAFVAFNNDPGYFDVVITDQTMPGLTGSELAKKILAIRPEIPIILTTGFSEIVSADLARAIGIRAYLMKPLVLTQLAETALKLVNEEYS